MKHDWEYKTFGEIMTPAKVVRCGNRTELPVLSITMREGIVQQSDRFKKVVASRDTKTYKVVQNGQLVIAFPIDEGLIYTQDIVNEGIMSPAYNIWDVDYSIIDRHFLVKYFHSSFAMDYYKNKLRGTTQRRRMLPKEELLSLPIPLPPIDEQKAICAELDALSLVIEKKKEQIKQLDNLAQSIFYDTFGDPATNKRNFTITNIGKIAVLKSGNSEANNSMEGDLPYVKVGDMNISGNENYITTSSRFVDRLSNKKNIFPKGTIIFPKRGGAIGTNKKRLCKVDICCDLNTMGVIPDKGVVEPLYVFQYFKNIDLGRLCNGATIPQINNGDIAPLKILLPPLSLQQTFAERIEGIERQKELINQSIREVQTLFDSRMDYYFRD